MSALSNKFVAFWELGEASGTRVDTPGTNDLTDNNTVTQAAGKVGNAAQFTAANTEYLSIASNAAVQAGNIDFTWCAWVYLDSKTTYRIILAKEIATAGNLEYSVYYDSGVDRFRCTLHRAVDVGVTVTANNLGVPSTATWYFLVVWHDAAADTVNIQVNNGTADSVASGGSLQAAGSADLNIGRTGDGGLPFDGRIDQVGFAKAVFTTDEKIYLYNGGNGRSWAEIVAAGTWSRPGTSFHPGRTMNKQARFLQTKQGHSAPTPVTVVFRKTLSRIGTRTGSRQPHND